MVVNQVDLQIGRIVIEGLSAHEQRRFGAELESQLHKLATDGLLTQSEGKLRKTIATLNAGALRPGATAKEAAAQIAQALVSHVHGQQPVRTEATRAVAPRGEASKHV